MPAISCQCPEPPVMPACPSLTCGSLSCATGDIEIPLYKTVLLCVALLVVFVAGLIVGRLSKRDGGAVRVRELRLPRGALA